MSILLAQHHPEAVKALLLWRVTGGTFAAERLAFNYYDQYLETVAAGGIKAVLATEHFCSDGHRPIRSMGRRCARSAPKPSPRR